MRWRLISFVKVMPLLCLALGSLQATASNHEYGVLFYIDTRAVDASTSQADLKERVDEWVQDTNTYYRSSSVDLQVKVTKVVFADITKGSSSVQARPLLDDMYYQRGVFSNALSLADEYGADYIYAVVGTDLLDGSEDRCGQAIAVNRSVSTISVTNRSFAVSESNVGCGSRTFAHEIGHLMGLAHGEWVASCEGNPQASNALTPYAAGFGSGTCDDHSTQRGDVGTIMVGNYIKSTLSSSVFDHAIYMVPFFSNLTVYDRTRCSSGTSGGYCGDAGSADASRALNQYSRYYSRHEEPDVHTLNYEDSALKNCIEGSYRYKEVEELTALTCYGLGIESLEGLDQLTSLSVVNLSNNELRSASPLLALNNEIISHIDLSGNKYLPCFNHSSLNSRYEGKILMDDSCVPVISIVTSILLN